jgi:hypothetical protein
VGCKAGAFATCDQDCWAQRTSWSSGAGWGRPAPRHPASARVVAVESSFPTGPTQLPGKDRSRLGLA